MVDYELINEINDNDQKAVDELIEEYENEERAKMVYENEKFATTDYEFTEGCIIDGSIGIYIPYNVVNFAIQMGFNPSIEWKQCVKEAKEKEEDEEDYLTHSYEWIYEEMENAESYMNDKFAKAGYYFGIFPDWGDWGYYKFEEEED